MLPATGRDFRDTQMTGRIHAGIDAGPHCVRFSRAWRIAWYSDDMAYSNPVILTMTREQAETLYKVLEPNASMRWLWRTLAKKMQATYSYAPHPHHIEAA